MVKKDHSGGRTTLQKVRVGNPSPQKGVVPENAQKDSDPLLGTTLDGKYQIISCLGQGGLGIVYRAEHLQLHRIIALKVLHAHLLEARSRETFLGRFEREAMTANKFRHPNAVTIHDFGVAGNSPYIVMEFLEGRSLGDIIRQESPIPLERILHIMRQLCNVLDEAHRQGLVHRDLKPDKILVSIDRNNLDHVVVLDFGLAKLLQADESETALTKAGAIIGTPKYMAPEQIQSSTVDERSDIYSLGVILYELLSGTVPFSAGSVTELLSMHLTEAPKSLSEISALREIPEQLNAAVLKALEKDPARRQPRVGDLLQELEASIECPANPQEPTRHLAAIEAHNQPGANRFNLIQRRSAFAGLVVVLCLLCGYPIVKKVLIRPVEEKLAAVEAQEKANAVWDRIHKQEAEIERLVLDSARNVVISENACAQARIEQERAVLEVGVALARAEQALSQERKRIFELQMAEGNEFVVLRGVDSRAVQMLQEKDYGQALLAYREEQPRLETLQRTASFAQDILSRREAALHLEFEWRSFAANYALPQSGKADDLRKMSAQLDAAIARNALNEAEPMITKVETAAANALEEGKALAAEPSYPLRGRPLLSDKGA